MSLSKTEEDLQNKRTQLRSALIDLTRLKDNEEIDKEVRKVLVKELKRLKKVSKHTEMCWDKYWTFYFMGDNK